MQSSPTDTSTTSPSPEHSVSALRGGAVLTVAAGASIALNYLFLIACGRLLGSDDYGDLAAILGLLTVVLLPSGALQMAVSREVSRRIAAGGLADARAFAHRVLVLGLLATVPVVALFAVLAVPVGHVLGIDSGWALVFAGVSLTATFLGPTGLGVVQGEQRFITLAVISFLPFLVRIVAIACVAVAGATLAGAVGAVALSAVAGLGLALYGARAAVHATAGNPGPILPFLRFLVPVVVGLIGMSMLVNLDVLVVNARFTEDQASTYAAASAFARVGYFLPSTILAVIFPRTAARQERGEATDDILGRSLLVTAAFCVLLAGAYAVVGSLAVDLSFGDEFEDAAALLPLFALEIALVSLANVLVGFHLSRGESRYAWMVAAAVPLQLLLLATVPDTLRGVIWVNVGVGAALLAAHEVFVGSSLPALRAGVHRLRARAA